MNKLLGGLLLINKIVFEIRRKGFCREVPCGREVDFFLKRNTTIRFVSEIL